MDIKKVIVELTNGLETFQLVNDADDETMVEVLIECTEIYKRRIRNKKLLVQRGNSE